MYTIHCQPDDLRFDAEDGATLLTLMVRAGIPIAHACGGKARCSTCRVRIEGGLDTLPGRTEAEQRIAERLSLPSEIRLACQTRAEAGVRLHRLVRDAEDVALASQLANPDAGGVGREKAVAVLFLDVEGFTSLSEALPAYDVIHVLNRFFEKAGEAITAQGGVISNYMGDGLMAVFDSGEEACADALRSGRGLMAVAASIDTYLQDLYDRRFRIRIGIHHGPAVVGHLGHRESRRETAIGDTVNLASRIEAANKETGTRFLVSDAVRQLAGEGFTFGRRFELNLRGRSGAFVLHQVVF